MLQFLHQLLDLNEFALGTVALLSILAAYLLREALEGGWEAGLSAPIFFFGSLCSIRFFMTEGIILTSDESSNLVIATGCGLILSLLMILIALRAYMTLVDKTAPMPQPGQFRGPAT